MKIAVIGSITEDEIIIPKRNERYTQPGGGVYYTSMALDFLDVKTLAFPILSKRDSDLLKAFNHTDIKVNPQWADETTKYRNTYYGETLDKCEKIILSYVKDFKFNKKELEKISDCDAVHLSPLFSKELKTSFYSRLRKNFKNTISLDGQGFIQGPTLELKNIFKNNIDIFKLDENEILQITSESNEESAINIIKKWNISEILVTKASKGSTVYYKNEQKHIPPVKTQKIVNSTGCGDAYMAGYLFKRLKGFSALNSGVFASEIAAKNLGFRGPLKKDY